MNWFDLAFYIPLGFIGLIRWVSWLIRRIPASLYRPYPSGHEEPISVVTPVYQEDPAIFRAAIESWLANDLVKEVICVIDQTDVVCEKIAGEYPVTVITTSVPGKRDALRKGWERASTSIVALVDSDTIWAPDVAARVCEPFADPSIAGVGTRQNVYSAQTIWQRINDMYLDYRYFDEIAAQTVVGQAVSCLSGRTAVYRKKVLDEVSEAFMNERFMGVQCNSGEDKRLTTLVLERGHRTYLQRSARVWSTFPGDFRTFLKQRLRWGRNTWRSDLRALLSGWVFRRPFLAFTMIDKAVSSFTLLLAPAYFVIALARADWLAASILWIWWMVSRGAKMLPHFRRRPAHVAVLPVFVVLSFLMALVKIYALMTVRTQKWLTRDVAVIHGNLVRTTAMSLPAGAMAAASNDILPAERTALWRRAAFSRPLMAGGVAAALAAVGFVLPAGLISPKEPKSTAHPAAARFALSGSGESGAKLNEVSMDQDIVGPAIAAAAVDPGIRDAKPRPKRTPFRKKEQRSVSIFKRVGIPLQAPDTRGQLSTPATPIAQRPPAPNAGSSAQPQRSPSAPPVSKPLATFPGDGGYAQPSAPPPQEPDPTPAPTEEPQASNPPEDPGGGGPAPTDEIVVLPPGEPVPGEI